METPGRESGGGGLPPPPPKKKQTKANLNPIASNTRKSKQPLPRRLDSAKEETRLLSALQQEIEQEEEEEEEEKEKEKGKYIIIYHTNHVCTISLAQSAVILHHFGQLEHTTQHCFDLKYCDTARTVALHDFGS